MSLARAIARFGAVVEATARARAVDRGEGPGAAGLAGAGAANGRLEGDVAREGMLRRKSLLQCLQLPM